MRKKGFITGSRSDRTVFFLKIAEDLRRVAV
jgi:hypothetical protein